MKIKDSLFDDIDCEVNSTVTQLSDEVVVELNNNISSVNYVKGFSDAGELRFSEPVNLANDDICAPADMGVYLIFCKSSLFYVGYGIISSRIGKFKRALKGEDNTHRGAAKSRQENPNILDYYFSYIRIPNEFLAKKLETYYIEMYSPKFAEASQAGK